jgi:hypothetical protein
MATVLSGLLTITTIPSLGAPAFCAVRMELTVRTSECAGAAASARQKTQSNEQRIELFMGQLPFLVGLSGGTGANLLVGKE